MKTFHIHIKGRVQGVGFRPFVYQLAQSMDLTGWVCNATDGVHIQFNASKDQADQFYKACLNKKPPLAIVTHSEMREVATAFFNDFTISESQNSPLELSISPDFSMCPTCAEEISDKKNRRYEYPFITCTQCGPRYSILTDLPYDRPYTAMDAFQMCPKCEAEYKNPTDRRYFSQTNSCTACGVQMCFAATNGSQAATHLSQSEMLSITVQKLREGHIVAVKGIGGFLLLCDAHAEKAISTLRQRKQRPAKPFAVLFPDLKTIEQSFFVSKEEKETLQSPFSPIVLLQPKNQHDLPIAAIAPGLERIGVMVPYAPILALLASAFGTPLIATSANLSGSPIVHGADESGLAQLADYVLSHNRPIIFPQDDSVVQLTPSANQPIILRRSRGLAPSILHSLPAFDVATLALGAEMKGAFALSVNSNTYVSQYLGNLGHYENQRLFEELLDKFTPLVQVDVQQLVMDAHPGYFTHQLGRALAEKAGIPRFEIQHHEAHFAAVLAENALMEQNDILGVIWDGTGMGADGHSWGGEFFEYSEYKMRRIAHLAYFHNLSNDRMAIDNRLCALSIAGEHNWHHLVKYFNATEWGFFTKKLQQRSGTMTSSMGRLFDAIGFLAGISAKNSYEGQAAMLLEQHAQKAFSTLNNIRPYPFEVDGQQILLNRMIDEVFQDRQTGYAGIAARFHLTLVALIRKIAEDRGYKKIAFSGGVFQNGLLVDLLIAHLKDDFHLYFHKELSPNDENIAYGQLAHMQYIQEKETVNYKSVEQCV